jgi:hypothetical protein
MSSSPLFAWVSEDWWFLTSHFLENKNRSSDGYSKWRKQGKSRDESIFNYPSKKKYGMFAYVMRYRKLKGKSVLKIKLILTMFGLAPVWWEI